MSLETGLESKASVVVDLYIKGWTQTEIANHLDMAQGHISRIIKKVRNEWREQRVSDMDDLVNLELKKLDKLEREAWSAWERSQKPAQEAETVTKDGADLPTKKKIKGQSGDPRHLAVVAKCIERRCELLGLDAPKKMTMDDAQIDQWIADEVERLARTITVESIEAPAGLPSPDPATGAQNGSAGSNGHSAHGPTG